MPDDPARTARSRADVEHLLDDALAAADEDDPALPHFVSDPRAGLAGVIATVEWVLGHTHATPITGDHTPVTVRVWSRERGRALDVIEGASGRIRGITDDYAAFVKRTLDWIGIPSANRPL
ncbi:hypothetical protein [Embleya sp. NPDC005971]|uniref:hypothetical protein n=1 Tax=Embleya sp. NPDC005971 TaxID=3156724 RepID=UPI0033BFDD24